MAKRRARRAVSTPSPARPGAQAQGPPPVHLWNPPFCGDLDMRIAADGTWFYLKTPIGRPALVKLFASVLKREGDKYFLVTPVEKCGIVGRRRAVSGGRDSRSRTRRGVRVLHFRTNVDDWVACGRGPCVALRAGAGDRRAQALPACAARPVGEGDAGLVLRSGRARRGTRRSMASACSASPRGASSSPWRRPTACGSSRDGGRCGRRPGARRRRMTSSRARGRG